MAGVQAANKNAITLKGSTEIVAEFFDYAINSILYQRGIYPTETFTHTQKYGLTLLVTTDEDLKTYLADVLTQIRQWLLDMTVQKLVIVFHSIETNEVLERWQFDVQCDKSAKTDTKPRDKREDDIRKEISGVIRQIVAAVTFLPLLECACAFDILVYTDKDMDVPETWGESGPALISKSDTVRFRTLSTTIHKVESMVTYKSA